MTDKPEQLWTDEAVANAKKSTLPVVAQPIAEELKLDVADVVDAIEVALLSLTVDDLDNMENAVRTALRPIVEEYAQVIGVDWMTAADAIIGSIEWTLPDPRKWHGGADPWTAASTLPYEMTSTGIEKALTFPGLTDDNDDHWELRSGESTCTCCKAEDRSGFKVQHPDLYDGVFFCWKCLGLLKR